MCTGPSPTCMHAWVVEKLPLRNPTLLAVFHMMASFQFLWYMVTCTNYWLRLYDVTDCSFMPSDCHAVLHSHKLLRKIIITQQLDNKQTNKQKNHALSCFTWVHFWIGVQRERSSIGVHENSLTICEIRPPLVAKWNLRLKSQATPSEFPSGNVRNRKHHWSNAYMSRVNQDRGHGSYHSTHVSVIRYSNFINTMHL